MRGGARNTPVSRSCRVCGEDFESYARVPSPYCSKSCNQHGSKWDVERHGPCGFPGCDRAHFRRGLCNAHFQQAQKGRDLKPLFYRETPQERWTRFVAPAGEDECWPWKGARLPTGYGCFFFEYDGKKHSFAHRASHMFHIGPIPPGHHVDHLCHRPECVNPKHLRAVNARENARHRKGANKNNRTGLRGVYYSPDKGMYMAHLKLAEKFLNLGWFPTAEAADCAVREARLTYFGEVNV